MTSREKEEASAWCMEEGPALMVNGHAHPSWPRTENGILTRMGPDPAGARANSHATRSSTSPADGPTGREMQKWQRSYSLHHPPTCLLLHEGNQISPVLQPL